MFLAHELTRYFRAKHKRTLAFVMLEGPGTGVLTAPVFNAFKSFSNNMLFQSNREYLSTLAFSCEEKNIPPMSDFAAYILRILAENKKTGHSRWFKFTKLKTRPPGRPPAGLKSATR
jgi:phospholipid N-methyltransferase